MSPPIPVCSRVSAHTCHRSQVQILSNQVSNLITSITRQHTHMAITAEILCFMVQAIREHAPAPVADMFQSWTPGSYGPYSSHSHSSSSRKARRSSDSDEFCARIDPVEEPTPMPPRPRSPSPAPCLNEAAAPSAETNTSPPHTESTSPPLAHGESNWQVPSDWDTQRGGSRKPRREGAFMHTPDWEEMKNVYGRLGDDGGDDGGTPTTTDAVDSTGPAHPAQSSPTEEQPRGTQSSNSSSQANASAPPPLRCADSPDRAELERRIAELQAYIDAGFEGRLPTYQNQMAERTSGAGSVDVSSSPILAPVDPPSHVPTTSSASGKKRSRSRSQSPSPARSSPSPSAPTDSLTILESDDEDTATEPRAAKRRRVSPARPTPAASSSKAGQPTYRTPTPTPVPEPSSAPSTSAAASVSSSGPRTRAQARRRPLTRTATMANID